MLCIVSYILGGEELHALGHLEGKAQQVVKGQGLQVACLIIWAFVDLWSLQIKKDELGIDMGICYCLDGIF